MNSLSNTIIKSFKTRLLPPEKRPLLRRTDGDDPAAPEEGVGESEHDAAVQAAYDEVIEAAQREVTLLLEDARRQAREIISGADKQVETEMDAAHTEGYRMGISEGYDDGVDKVEKTLEALLREGQEEVDQALSGVYAERDRLLGEMEPKVLRLALDVAEKIVGYELEQNDNAFVSLVTAALDTIRCESRVTLRINAERHTGSFRSKAEVRLKTEQGGVEAELISDMAVSPNGCLIETGSGTVDASVETQIEQIAQNMGLE
jgi:flagellar assembly protein FliH